MTDRELTSRRRMIQNSYLTPIEFTPLSKTDRDRNICMCGIVSEHEDGRVQFLSGMVKRFERTFGGQDV